MPMKPARFLAALMRTGYLPIELPPVVTAKYFADFCEKNYGNIKSRKSTLLKLSTQYETFSAPKTASGRRNFGIVHPLSQMAVALVITENRHKIATRIQKNKTTHYITAEDSANSRAFAGLDFAGWKSSVSRLGSESPYLLKADVSRFFYTVYTHSVPWAILGKKKAKELFATNKKALRAHWSNDLDMALQACQSRETFGLPVGPDTSRIVAELLLSEVERDATFFALTKERSSHRLLDDFLVGFSNRSAAEQALVALRAALWKFNLQLNETKTVVIPSKDHMLEKWKLEFDAASLSHLDAKSQASDLARLIELTLHACADSKSATPATWACRRLSRIDPHPENFDLFLDALFRLSRDFPPALHYVVVFIVNHQAACRQISRIKRIEHWVKSSIRKNIEEANDFESSWHLLASGVMGIALDGADLKPNDRLPSFTVLAILGLLRQRGLLKMPLSKWNWRAALIKNGPLRESWLLHYEAVKRKWTKDPKIVATVTGNALLNDMLQADVSFLEDNIFKAKRINLSRRSYRTRTRVSGVSLDKEIDAATISTYEAEDEVEDDAY